MRHVFFPDDMREFVITRHHVLAALVPWAVKFLIILFLTLFGIAFIPLVLEYGFAVVLSHTSSLLAQFAETLWPVLVALALFALAMRFIACRQKVIGIPVWYGFDESSVYFHDRYGSSMYRWEYFYSWRETKQFFLLNDGVRRVLWPKAAWSAEEIDALRALMRKNISSKRVKQ